MDNSLNLSAGRQYSVVKSFIDYDNINHPVGETWIYEGTNFLPYEDGLTLHVLQNHLKQVYRLQWKKEEQGKIIENFGEYVELKV